MSNPVDKNTIAFLEHKALQIRINSIKATTASKSGHPTSCLSAADIIASLFFHVLKFDPQDPAYPNNDRFIMSKGHAIPVVYAAYAELGIISEQELLSLRKFDSILEGHPTPRFKYNEAATGSLGQGLGIGLGFALNAQYDQLSYRTYVMIGDGEIAEGSIWEAAQLASRYNIDNLIGIMDCNRLAQSGESINNHDVDTYAKRFEAFGWQPFIIDGHNIEEIVDALSCAEKVKHQPVAIIAKTFKGYGLKDIQNKHGYHGKPFTKEQVDEIIAQLKQNFSQAATYHGEKNYKPNMPQQHAAAATTLAATKTSTLSMPALQKSSHEQLFASEQKIATRKAFGYALEDVGAANKNIYVLDADVQNSTFTELFAQKFPDRFLQCFVAEQNMVSVATGLYSRGKIPFAATFACFLSRAHDQIRMGAIGRCALRLCGSHAGVSIGEDGPSQMGLEDIAMMRSIPDSVVLYPSDGVSAYKLTTLMADYHDGISYLRTTRSATPMLYNHNEEFTIGGCKVLKQSNQDDVCIIAAGITLHEALKAYDQLQQKGINTAIIDLYSIKPLDLTTIKKVVAQSKNNAITVEDHYLEGGMGEAVAQGLINEQVKMINLAVNNISRSATPAELLSHAGIDASSIIKAVEKILS